MANEIRRVIEFMLLSCWGWTLVVSAHAQLTPTFASRLTLDPAFVTGAAQATDIAFSGDGRALVTRKTGEIAVRRANGTVATIAYPFPATLDTASEKGLLGIVADPQVATNNTFYFYVSNGPTNDKHRVYKAVLTPSDTLTVDTTPIIGASRGFGPGLEGPANHDGGGLFIAGNMLYVGVGDTGNNATPPVNKYGSCLNRGNGKILRVQLDGTVPSSNPLPALTAVTGCTAPTGAWQTGVAPDRRIFAWGMRNPWRFWIDSETNLLWIGDVGETTREEISVGGGNQHYGYPFVEGDRAWGNVDGQNCNTETPSRSCTPPVYAYDHTVGSAVTGGLIPHGCGWNNVFGGTNYVFGDSSSDWIRALPVNAARSGVTSTTPTEIATFASQAPVSFRMGPDGSLYVVMNAGNVYKLTPTARTGADCGASVPVADRGSYLPLWAALALLTVGLSLSGMNKRRSALRQ